jgi:hydrogenase nickel incorporation protein HypB
MCGTCGCSDNGHQAGGPGSHGGHSHHAGGHGHEHAGGGGHGNIVDLQERVLARNDALAADNREWLRRRGVLAVNLMSSPGSGKTTLLERTARHLAGQPRLSVIEGDQETSLDAARIRSAGCQVVQINTGTGCHLDAAMVAGALHRLDPPPGSLVAIENVGNLVCPAMFDLGEAARVVLASVTEGADKPEKYPAMFRRADLVLITKTDLLPYVDFDTGRCAAGALRASPGACVLEISATTGTGMPAWYGWLSDRLRPVAGRRDDRLAEADPAVVTGDARVHEHPEPGGL